MIPRGLLALAGFFFLAQPALAQDLVGIYVIRSEADKKQVEVEHPVLLTVTIQGKVPPGQAPPQQEKLRIFTEKAEEKFFIDPLPEKAQVLPEEGVWLFVYRLRPKSTSVEYIPSLKLTMLNPVRKKSQSSFADPIPLKVLPARKREAAPPLKVLRAPETFLQLRSLSGSGVFPRPTVRSILGGSILFSVPLVCAIGCWLWKRGNPNLAKVDARRRSRAAQRALQSLAVPPAGPEAVEALALSYVRDRLDFPSREATAPEVELFLKRRGVSKALARRWALFFHLCAQGRFAPGEGPATPTLAEEAADLIRALEDQPCLPA